MFQEGDSIWTRDYRGFSEKWVHGIILHQLGPVTYKVKVDDLVWKRHVDQIHHREPSVTVDISRSFNGGDIDFPHLVPLPPTYVAEHQQEESSPAVTSSGHSPEPVVQTPVRDKLVDSARSASPKTEPRLPRRLTRGVPPKKLDLQILQFSSWYALCVGA